MTQRSQFDDQSTGNHPGGVALGLSNVAIDALSVTYRPPAIAVNEHINQIVRELFPDISLTIKVGNGNFGFQTGFHLLALIQGRKARIGSIYQGGKAQSACWLIQLTGQGCSLIRNWQPVHSFLLTLVAKVTRIDLCQDYKDGKVTIDEAVNAYFDGHFNVRGRRPSCRQHGDWLEKKQGRTLYVGHAANGKQARIYEKGKQLGQLNSPWVRAEVQFTGKRKEIPLDVLLNPAGHFAGAFPIFARWSAVAALVIPARQKVRVAELSKKLYHLRKTYGVTVAQALMTEGCTPEDLVNQLALPSYANSGKPDEENITWKEVKKELTNY